MVLGVEGSDDVFFEYALPLERIAERPLKERDACRLLHAVSGVSKSKDVSDSLPAPYLKIEELYFKQLCEVLSPGDLLILNDSRVFPRRFFFEVDGREVELLLLRKLESNGKQEIWEALGKPLKRLEKAGSFELCPELLARVVERTGSKVRISLELADSSQLCDIHVCIQKYGVMPIPPYIRKGHGDLEDKDSYQTVYCQSLSPECSGGSVAAPTAGLHFSNNMLSALKVKGVRIAYLTLHVGAGSFMRVDSDPRQHQMESEEFYVPAETVREIEEAKRDARRVIAVGTTCCRALESAALKGMFSEIDVGSGNCVGLVEDSETPGYLSSRLFIMPGFEFKVIDALVTNFHQPRSTHLLLVSALIGSEALRKIYAHALEGNYRFLSYGDAMFLEKGE